jgi:hypothetical protein
MGAIHPMVYGSECTRFETSLQEAFHQQIISVYDRSYPDSGSSARDGLPSLLGLARATHRIVPRVIASVL